jgi:hypothetical protein
VSSVPVDMKNNGQKFKNSFTSFQPPSTLFIFIVDSQTFYKKFQN